MLDQFFVVFNWVFDRLSTGYGERGPRLLRMPSSCSSVYGGLLGLTVVGFQVVPTGFIPSRTRDTWWSTPSFPTAPAWSGPTRSVTQISAEIALETDGVAHIIGVPGYSVLTSNNIPNVGGMFVILKPFEERQASTPELHGQRIAAGCGDVTTTIQEAQVGVFGAPPVDGLGSTGGFKMQILDRGEASLQALEGAVGQRGGRGQRATPGWRPVQHLQRQSAAALRRRGPGQGQEAGGGPGRRLRHAASPTSASAYVNDITLYNRNWQVNVQADAKYRIRPADIGKLKVRNAKGDMVPLSTLVTIKEMTGPAIVNHYNLYPSAEINGNPPRGPVRPGHRDHGQGGAQELPKSMGYEWTELTFQQIEAGKGLAQQTHLPTGSALRLHGAGRAVRELVAAAGDPADRADVRALGADRPVADRAGQQHLRPDRPGGAWSGWRPRTPSLSSSSPSSLRTRA